MEAPSLPAVSEGLFRCLVFDVALLSRLMSPPIAPGGRTLLRGRKLDRKRIGGHGQDGCTSR
jgi:hypothetical protein